MTRPDDDPTAEQPAVSPTVSTAPAQGPTRRRWNVSRIPAHLGRARTSTVVLAVLFVAIFALYLNIRPETPGTAPASGGTGTEQPATTPTPTAPTTTPVPTPTTTAPESIIEDPPVPTEEPTDTTAPEETGSPLPTTSSPDGPASSPTTVSPPN